jgi:hypothetical protein
MNTVNVTELQPCDVLLYQGNGFFAKSIRLLDSGPYSHAGLYMGLDNGKPYVAEMVPGGFQYRPLAESIKGSNYVNVHRYYSDGREVIGSPNLPIKPVLDREGFYQQQHDRYAYEQILLLAMICITRSLPIYPKQFIKTILEEALDLMKKMSGSNKTPMVCSGLVYRCFDEAKPKSDPQYKIRTKEAELALAKAIQYEKMAIGAEVMESEEDKEIILLKANFLEGYMFATYGLPPDIRGLDAVIESVASPADFVTPNGLGRSVNINKLGTLSL